METQLLKLRYVDNEQFLVDLEFFDGVVFIHCLVHSWNLSTLKKMYSYFKELKQELSSIGIQKIVTVTPNPKFAKLFGGNTVNKIDYLGAEYEVITWELK